MSAPALSRPEVSVITIFRDAEQFLAEAVESVRRQTFAGWELLLVDDGSQDGSSAIARDCASADPARVRYLMHPGRAARGTGASRNLGMCAARGECIAFLDADDLFLPERLAHHRALLATVPAPAVVIGSELYWRSWDGSVGPGLDHRQRVGVPDGARFAPPALLTLMLEPELAWAPGICSVTFHAAPRNALPLVPESFVSHAEDLCLVGALLADRTALVTDACLARYRQHPGSTTARARARGEYDLHGNHPDDYRYLRWLERRLASDGQLIPELERALRARLAPVEHPLRATLGALPRAGVRAVFEALRALLPVPLVDSAAARYRVRREGARRTRISERCARSEDAR